MLLILQNRNGFVLSIHSQYAILERVIVLKKIYLDNCCYNRPFDDQTQIKIHLETQAKLCIQAQIRDGKYSLVWSYILDYENGQNPYVERRQAITPWKNLASEFADRESEQILSFAEALGHKGIKPFDALHIACAVSVGCKYFITMVKNCSIRLSQRSGL